MVDETLSIVFHLRDLPEEIERNRKGRAIDSFEYMWRVYIDTDLADEKESDRFEYMFAAFTYVASGETETPPATQLLEEALDFALFEAVKHNMMIEVPTESRLTVSSGDNTITLIGEVPGILPESHVAFRALDPMRGFDTNSCPPN